jgi:hypothetical protein
MSSIFERTAEQRTRMALNDAHVDHPYVGDYWSEMVTVPICAVLAVTLTHVLVQRLSCPMSRRKPHLMTRGRFKQWLCYGCIPGTWADVTPRRFPDATVFKFDKEEVPFDPPYWATRLHAHHTAAVQP